MRNAARFYILFGILYLAQSIPGGFVMLTLLDHLDQGGLTLSERGAFIAIIGSPWALKALWGPIVDRWGTRIRWIISSTLLMSLTIMILPLFDKNKAWLVLAVLVHNLGRSVLDVATDGMAVDILKGQQRSGGQAAMVVGRVVGTMIGGAGMLFLTKHLSWWTICGITTGLMIMSGTIAPTYLLLKTAVSSRVRQPEWRGWRNLVKSFKTRAPITGIVIAFLALPAQAICVVVYLPWLRDKLGYDKSWISALEATSGWMKIGGTLLGGYLGAKLPRKVTFTIGVLLTSLAYAGVGVLSNYWSSEIVVFGLVMSTAVADGLYMVVLLTMLMSLTNEKGGVATQYALFMAMINLAAMVGAKAGGVLTEHFSIAEVFIWGGALQLIALVPLLAVRKEANGK